MFFVLFASGLTNSARAQNTNPPTDAFMIALQVVRTSFGFHLRECMGSCFSPSEMANACSAAEVVLLHEVTNDSALLKATSSDDDEFLSLY